MRVLLCADGLAQTAAATGWLERMSPVEPSPLCVAAIARTGPLALRSSASFQPVRDLIVDRSRQLGETAAARLQGRWTDLTVRVAEGDPHEQLLRVAAEWKADLVVVGLGGDGPQALSAGSLARVAAHHLECSVLLAAGAPEAVPAVVLGMDGSASARQAVRLLSLGGFAPPPRVLALGIVDTSWRLAIDVEELPATAIAALRAIQAEQTAEARAALARGTAALAGQAIVESEVVLGNPVQVLLGAARERRADLIAIGHQGLEPVRRLPLGSVAAQLLATPPCSLLIGRM
jgi:nucleotide-binding universal stress UspA family protein